MRNISRLMQLAPLSLWVFATPVTAGEVTVAPYFGSHMVLQRDKPVTVWGKAGPGQIVEVVLGDNAREATATAAGEWSVVFAPLPASFEPVTLQVGATRYEDILVGEVWLNSGQSNMVWPLAKSDGFQGELLEENRHLRLLRMQNPRNVAKDGYTEEELARSNVSEFFKGQWEISDADSAAAFSAVAWTMGDRLVGELGVPVGLVQVAVGGSAINNWLPPELLRRHEHTSHLYKSDWLSNDKALAPHRRRAREAFQSVLVEGDPYVPGEMLYRWMCEPGFLFEAGISPLRHIAFKGVTWYQGESDAVQYETTRQYRDLLPLLIKAWRETLRDESLPFVIVQLPRFKVGNWPLFRQIQKEVTEQVSNTSLVVAIDRGFENDIHPTDKRSVGERMAIAALDRVYARKGVAQYPTVSRIRTGGDRVRIVLQGFDLGQVGTVVPGFEVGNEYGEFFPAAAVFTARNRIEIRSELACPRFVRYGWAPYPKPDLTLINSDDMPLGPFQAELSGSDSCN